MPLVRFLVDVGGAWAAYEEVDLTEDQASKWCDGYRAEYVTPKTEKPEKPLRKKV